MISVQNLHKHFGNIHAVNNVSFEISKGEVVGFLGPNGAGKSTTMRIITGFLAPSSGKVTIDGININKAPVEAKSKIGYLPESTALYPDMVVIDFLFFVGRMRGLKHSQLMDRISDISDKCRLGSVLNRKINVLSKGYKQRVGLAQALLTDPQVLILDEPTIGLDPNQIGEIRDLIKEIGKTKTILLSSHILPEVSSTCQRLLVINNGGLVAEGTPESLSKNSTQYNKYRLGIRGDVKIIHEKISELPHFLNLELVASQSDLHELSLTCTGEQNFSEDIFDMAVNNNWRMTTLIREQVSLEDVFKGLTQ